jgi:transglutaminase-like putative cysteine protease
MHYSIGCRLAYRVKAATPFVFNIEAARHAGQTINRESLAFSPALEAERWVMPETGNRYMRVVAPEGRFELRYEAEVTLHPLMEDPARVSEIPAGQLPLDTLTHLWPSRYCQADKLNRFAMRTFGKAESGHARVNAICNWIHDFVDYEGGVSDEMTSAFDIATLRAGVCRDFAHLGIALCRALGIPARYVSGYAYRLDPPDFHAVLEAFLEGPQGPGWYLFDPTRKAAPDGIVRIGIGRDAADVAFAVPFGAIDYDKPEVWITAEGETTREITTKAVRAEL